MAPESSPLICLKLGRIVWLEGEGHSNLSAPIAGAIASMHGNFGYRGRQDQPQCPAGAVPRRGSVLLRHRQAYVGQGAERSRSDPVGPGPRAVCRGRRPPPNISAARCRRCQERADNFSKAHQHGMACVMKDYFFDRVGVRSAGDRRHRGCDFPNVSDGYSSNSER